MILKSRKIYTLIFTVVFYLLMCICVYADTHTSVQSGTWESASTWSPASVPAATDNAIIAAGTVVTLPNGGTGAHIINLTVNDGGIVSIGNKSLYVDGNLVLNGAIVAGAINSDLHMTASGTTIDGTGYIDLTGSTHQFFYIDNNISFLSSADLLFTACVIQIASSKTLTNNGIVTVENSIVGSDASSTWTNAANSTLKCGSDILLTGILNASASGNIVEYYSQDDRDVKQPSSNQYYHLNIAGSGYKYLTSDIDVDGNFDITGLLDVTYANFKITLAGNWNNNNLFYPQNGVVEFNGTTDQTITNFIGETFYDMTVNKSSGLLILNNNVIVQNTLTMTQGNIVPASSSLLTLGTAADPGSEGVLNYTAGIIVGEFERWCSQTSISYLFPVGTSSDYRPSTPIFASLTGGSLIVKFVSSAPGNSGLPLTDGPVTLYNTFVDGYWDLAVNNGLASGNYDLELTGNGFTCFTIGANTRFVTRANSGASWSANGTHASVSGNTINRTGISILSAQFAFADNTNCTGPSTSSISGNTTVCAGTTGEAYSVVNTSGSIYYWTITGGTQASGGNTNSITVDWGPTGMMGEVKVVEKNSCSYGSPVILPITIPAIAPSSISGFNVIDGKDYVGEYSTGIVYSVTNQTGYTYTWTITGGTQASGGTTNSITVDWGPFGNGNVRVVSNNTACGNSSYPVDLPVHIYEIIESITSGAWRSTSTWDCSCIPQWYESVRINNMHTVTTSDVENIKNIIIANGGKLQFTSATANKRYLYVSGDITNNGDLTSLGTGILYLTGSDKEIDGTGRFGETSQTINIEISGGLKTILSNSTFNQMNGKILIKSGNTVTNNGNITTAGSIDGQNATTSRWVNNSYSQLHVGGKLFTTTGYPGSLNAGAVDNTIDYNSASAQNVTSGIYYHLIVSNNSTKTLYLGNVDVNGNLTISGSAALSSASTYDITIAGDWNNLSGAADPFIEGTRTVTFDGTNAQGVSSNSGETFYNLIINNTGSGIIMNNLINTTTNLTLTNGALNLNSYPLTVQNANTAAVTRTNGYVVSETNSAVNTSVFTWNMGTTTGSFIFPFGATDGSYIPVTFNKTTATSANVSISTRATATTDNQPLAGASNGGAIAAVTCLHDLLDNDISTSSVIDRWWDIYPSAAVIADVTFSYCGAENTTSDPTSEIAVQHWTGSIWNNGKGGGNGTYSITGTNGVTSGVGSVTATGLTEFSPYVLVLKSNPLLPVELLSFTAEKINNAVKLEWETASELNNDYFTIERSINMQDWNIIGKVKGSGTVNSITGYKFFDEDPSEGINYYKLKQTDYDGAYEELGVIAVDFLKDDDVLIIPNSDNTGIVILLNNSDREMQADIYDLSGRLVECRKIKSGTTSVEINIDRKGVYFIHLTGVASVIVRKILLE